MGEKKSDPKPEDLKPGTVAGELDAWDNLVTPVRGALKAAEDWKKGQGGKK